MAVPSFPGKESICPWRTQLPFCLVSRGSPTTPTGSVPWLSPLCQVCQLHPEVQSTGQK
ncbi:hypothetical protein PAMP_008482 [Pampus punctatissimus]